MLVGETHAQAKVRKLWYGLTPWIQGKLWWAGLTPETATWGQVAETARLAEVSHKAAIEAVKQPGGGRPFRNTGDYDLGTAGRRPSRTPGASLSTGRKAPSLRSGSNPSGRDSGWERGRTTPGGGPSNSQSRSNTGGRPWGGNTSRSSSTRPPLSEKDKADLLAAGKCFTCRETGHMQRNCPKQNRLHSNMKGKPPGLTSFNIELDLEGAEDLRVLAESTARIDELDLSSLEFDWTTLPREREDTDDGSVMPALMTPEPSECDLDGCSVSSGMPTLYTPDPTTVGSECSLPSESAPDEPWEEPNLSDGESNDLHGGDDPRGWDISDMDSLLEDTALLRSWDSIDDSDLPSLCSESSWGNPDNSAAEEDRSAYLEEDELITNLVLPPLRPRGVRGPRLGYLRNVVPDAAPGDALSRGLQSVLDVVLPFPDQSRRLTERPTASRFACFQHDGFVEIQDHYISGMRDKCTRITQRPLSLMT
ncbi:hypothetical protein C8Q80DRAFT_1157978 [Daedaleopsis nitida]|nr:hypothetical protein C8Q80DRAFT_1188943 [Daedaleopsis nitida]KAI0751564.1 hypothetical protein C8Q80DRAFT_1157978 [Daedaleopsis nitida]